MIAITLLLAASTVPQSLLDASDAAALAQTRCLYATFRAANQVHASPVEFESRMRSNCSAQSRELSRLTTRIFTLRGDANPSAEAGRMIEEGYRTMVEEYRRFPEKEKLMRDFCTNSSSTCR